MAVLKGKNGVVKIGTHAIANVTSYSVSEEADMLETTSIGASINGRTYVLPLMLAPIDVVSSMSASSDTEYDVTFAIACVPILTTPFLPFNTAICFLRYLFKSPAV